MDAGKRFQWYNARAEREIDNIQQPPLACLSTLITIIVTQVFLLGCGPAIVDRDGDVDGEGEADSNADAGIESATRYADWNDGIGISIVDPVGTSLDGYVRGGDFELWDAPPLDAWTR